jgi:hypothetical protein
METGVHFDIDLVDRDSSLRAQKVQILQHLGLPLHFILPSSLWVDGAPTEEYTQWFAQVLSTVRICMMSDEELYFFDYAAAHEEQKHQQVLTPVNEIRVCKHLQATLQAAFDSHVQKSHNTQEKPVHAQHCVTCKGLQNCAQTVLHHLQLFIDTHHTSTVTTAPKQHHDTAMERLFQWAQEQGVQHCCRYVNHSIGRGMALAKSISPGIVL